jgi:hypothetical protein
MGEVAENGGRERCLSEVGERAVGMCNSTPVRRGDRGLVGRAGGFRGRPLRRQLASQGEKVQALTRRLARQQLPGRLRDVDVVPASSRFCGMGPVFRRFTAASPLKWALAGRWGCLAIWGSHGAWLLVLC